MQSPLFGSMTIVGFAWKDVSVAHFSFFYVFIYFLFIYLFIYLFLLCRLGLVVLHIYVARFLALVYAE